MDPYEIEDTSDWLGCPTPLETCRHQLRMLENEIEELTLQLRQARQNIFELWRLDQTGNRKGLCGITSAHSLSGQRDVGLHQTKGSIEHR